MNVLCICIDTVMTVLCRWPQKAVAMNTKRGITWNPAHKYLQMTNIAVPGWQSPKNTCLHKHAFLLIFKILSYKCCRKLINSTESNGIEQLYCIIPLLVNKHSCTSIFNLKYFAIILVMFSLEKTEYEDWIEMVIWKEKQYIFTLVETIAIFCVWIIKWSVYLNYQI